MISVITKGRLGSNRVRVSIAHVCIYVIELGCIDPELFHLHLSWCLSEKMRGFDHLW